jgi:hypothetical protein
MGTACFATPPAGYLGNSGTFIIAGPGYNKDVAIEKSAHLRESMKLQCRAELFNAMSHAQFRNPDSLVGDANFGQVNQARNARQIRFGMKLLW